VGERWTGRRVVAHLGQAGGGYAELAVAPVGTLHEIPDHVATDAAVAMIGTGRTAMGILDVAELSADDVVLVTAAAGGLGSLLVQGAGNAGAVVVGVAGGPVKVQRVLELGANVAVDYLLADWPGRVRNALGDRRPSVVLDGVGGSQGRAAMQLLRAGGRLVLFGWSSGEPTPVTAGDIFAGGLTVTAAVGPRMLERPGGLREFENLALEALAAGRLVPAVGQPWPLAQAPAAHTAVETRATMGKTILVPDRRRRLSSLGPEWTSAGSAAAQVRCVVEKPGDCREMPLSSPS
jgi:NADPH2:quinone reductase